MDRFFRYLIITISITVIGLLLWYFSSIVSYLLIAAFLSILGKPLVQQLTRIHIRKWQLPVGLAAAITLVAMWCLILLAFRFFIPLVVNQASELSTIDINKFVSSISDPLHRIEEFFGKDVLAAQQVDLKQVVTENVTDYVKGGAFAGIFGSITGFVGNIFVAIFAISFISFFFLKDQKLFEHGVLVFVPAKYEDKVTNALTSVFGLLKRYFIGIVIEVIGVALLVTVGMLIVGINFQTAVVLGLISGLLNVIPYIGPIVGTALGGLIGIAVNLHMDFYTGILPILSYMALVYLIVQIIDNILFQPFIYSNSVNAHPLEIFLVILIAGSLAGIVGMILAIPAYTVIRVFAKEFFNNFKVVKELTKKI